MAGIYIHIPFCKTKCSYCDFFSKTNYSLQTELVKAMKKEIVERKTYLNNTPVSTIYFGGGTPSTLLCADIQGLLETVFSNFPMEKNAEITLEANPDDLSISYLTELRKAGINRLSIGIQSFDNQQLKFILRRHTAETAIDAVKNAQSLGFDNISVDLIYGLPGQSLSSWKKQINIALSLDVQHISAYGLTYEQGTVLWQQLQNGTVKQTDDETMIEMYKYLVSSCIDKGYETYEISNFALPDFKSRHNSSYWKQQAYLGIGPAAHSYNGDSRQWNIASIKKYCDNVNLNNRWFEKEILTKQDKYNDFVMVSLRTSEGIDLKKLKDNFGIEKAENCMKSAKKYIESNQLYLKEQFLRLTLSGILISDQIIVDLMICD